MAQQLSELPPLALIAFGVTAAIIFVVRYAGISAGANSAPQNNSATAQVAAVIVDPTALNAASASVRDLKDVLLKGQAEQEDHTHMICRRLETLGTQVDTLARALNAVTIEMARKH